MPRTLNYKTMKPREFPIWGRPELDDAAFSHQGAAAALIPQFQSIVRLDQATGEDLRQIRKAFIWLSRKVRPGAFYWRDPAPAQCGFSEAPHVQVFVECQNRAKIFGLRWGHLFAYTPYSEADLIRLGEYKAEHRGAALLSDDQREPMLRWLTGNNGYDDPAPLPRHRVRASQPHRCVIDRD